MSDTVKLNKPRENGAVLYASAFFLTFCAFILICALSGIAPFGDRVILEADLSNQYTSFLSYLRTVLSGENDLSYSFSKCLGGSMLGLAAYYLMSPFNLIFAFFSPESYPELTVFVLAAKLGVCALTMAVLLRRRGAQGAQLLALSSAYGLMAYNLVYSSNIMWLDGVYTLPLVALGIEVLVRKGDFRLFTGALAYALITNYYIAYMLCLFSVLYFPYMFACVWIERGKRPELYLVLKFAAGALISGGLAAFILAPAYSLLSATKLAGGTPYFGFERILSLKGFLTKLLCGSIKADDLIGSPPNVYIGIAAELMAALYFFNKRIKPGIRLASAALLLLVFAGLEIGIIYQLWHGMAWPSSFPNRHAFVFSFILVILANDCLTQHYDGGKLRIAVASGGALLLMAVLFDYSRQIYSNVAFLIADAVCIVIFALTLAFEDGKSAKRLTAAVLLVLQLFALTLNGYAVREQISADIDVQDYRAIYCSNSGAMAWLKEYDTSFYRTGNCTKRMGDYLTPNDTMMFGYNGISHYSSLESNEVKHYLGELGLMHCMAYWVSYGKDATRLLSSFLSVRYVLDQPDQTEYRYLEEENGICVYRNDNALDILYTADAACIGAVLDQNNMEAQESMAALAAGESFDIFKPVAVADVTTENLSAGNGAEGTCYARNDPAKQAALSYKLLTDSDGTIYAAFKGPGFQGVKVLVNGEPVADYFDVTYAGVIKLGTFSKGESVNVSLITNNNSLQIDEAMFCREDVAELERWRVAMERFSTDANIERLSSSHVRWSGMVGAEDCALVFSVPAEKGWTVTVDGEETQLETALGIMAAVRLEPGEHTVDFKYVPPGLRAGIAISAATILATVCIWALLRRRKRSEHE